MKVRLGLTPYHRTMPSSKGKVLLAMSGGVDSSVAAALLLREGYDIVGAFMRLGSPGDELDGMTPAEETCDPSKIKLGKQGCCSVGDAHDAKLVAAELGIPLYVCNFKRDFGRIMDYFVQEHRAGRTPNPCVRCNDWLKFGKLHEYAQQIGADFVASGHHARIVRRQGRAELWRGVDEPKDQSYVLFGAPQSRLDEMLLPVGEMTKSEVRAIASDLGLPVFDKPDSQEICFVPDNDHAAFVGRRAPDLVKEGAIVNAAGEQLGRHDGHHRFTIGQRRGVGVALGHPIYVIDKDPLTNTVTVGERDDLAVRGLEAAETNWLLNEDEAPDLTTGMEALVQHRAHGSAAPAIIRADPSRDTLMVRYRDRQLGVAPGQAVVCYDARTPDRVLGGGWITRTERG